MYVGCQWRGKTCVNVAVYANPDKAKWTANNSEVLSDVGANHCLVDLGTRLHVTLLFCEVASLSGGG